MGGHPWNYFVPFTASVEAALDALRQQVFASGQYHGSDAHPATPEEAFAIASPDGTRSILDMMSVSEEPEFCAVCPLSDAELHRLFGTAQPTHARVAGNPDLFENIERGQGVYVVVHDEQGRPAEYYFAGVSFD